MTKHGFSTLSTALLAALVTLTGCKKDAAATTSDAAAPQDGAKVGLANPANDPAVVEAAKAALACTWTPTGLQSSCEAMKTWRANPALKEGKADTTLVNMVADSDEKVRWLAASTLSTDGRTYRADKALAGQILAALNAEKIPLVAGALGGAAGPIDAKSTGMGEELKAAASKHPVVDARRKMVSNMLFRNPDYYDFIVELASDADAGVRKEAVAAFWVGTPAGKQETTCKLWLDKVDDSDDVVAANAAYQTSFWSNQGGCTAQWDELLNKLEARAKDGKIKESMMASSFGYLHRQAKATPAQKKRALELMQKTVENLANGGSARSNALRNYAEIQGPAAKAYVAKFAEDKEMFVRSTAKDYAEGKIPQR